MQAAVGRKAMKLLRLMEVQVNQGKEKVFLEGQTVEVEFRVECSMKKEKANLNEVKMACWRNSGKQAQLIWRKLDFEQGYEFIRELIGPCALDVKMK